MTPPVPEATISVIVPVYNGADYVRDCLESILCQSHGSIEVLVVDDGSTDCSGEICSEYARRDERVRVLRKANGGLPSARNAGLTKAKGRYVSFVDCDDLLLPEALRHAFETLERTGADVVQMGMLRFDRASEAESIAASSDPEVLLDCSGVEGLCQVYRGGVVSSTVWDKVYRRELIGDSVFDDGARYFAEDVLFLCNVLPRATRFLAIAHTGYAYRRTPGSLVTVGLNRDKFESSMYSYMTSVSLFRNRDQQLFRLSEALLCSGLINWRIRKNEMSRADARYLAPIIRSHMRRIIRSVLRNPEVRGRQRLLALFSCVSLLPVDLYAWLAASLARRAAP